jgi:hypothetical protein
MWSVCGETLANKYKSKEEGFFRAKLNSLNTQKLLLSEACGMEVKRSIMISNDTVTSRIDDIA